MRDKRPYFILTCLFLSVVFLFFVFYFLPKREDMLERENRYAASLPTFSPDGFLKGDFSRSLSAFASDRLPFRDGFYRAATLFELTLGKREHGGILYAGRGRLIPLPKGTGAFSESNARAVEMLCGFGVPFYRFTVPTPYSVYTAGEVDGYTLDDYYRTDHHLNDAGSIKLAGKIAEKIGVSLPSVELEEFDTDFYGTSAAALGGDLVPPDNIFLPHYEGEASVEAWQGGKRVPIYDRSASERRDRYSVFLGGNHPLLEIKKAEGERPRLLVIKDSYMNAAAPMLAASADLLLCDPRYFHGDFDALVAAYAPDAILLVSGSDLLSESDALTRLFDTW